MAQTINLPELGEGVESGTISQILVSSGDSVKKDTPILEIETDKAVAEIPAGVEGTIKDIKVSEGDTINVGDAICTVEAGAAADSGSKEEESPKESAKDKDEAESKDSGNGKGGKAAAKEEAEKSEPEKSEPAKAESGGRGGGPKLQVLERPEKAAAEAEPARRRGGAVLASPTVRRMAREHGVDIASVPTADPNGRVTAQDVLQFVRGGKPAAAALSGGPAPAEQPARASGANLEEDTDRWGLIAREPMNAIRKKTVQHMTHCWTTIPHVTHQDYADVTALEQVRKKFGKQVEQDGGKLTATSFIIKVVAEALKRFPKFNASVDTENEQVILKRYYHIGVAVDTPNGLLVPSIRDADKKSITQISVELPQLAEKARDRKLSLEEMQGSTFTVTNLGGIGGASFTPIINAPEVAILGVSRGRVEPVFENGQFAPRMMLPLSLSYDHRLIDGADAARFTRWVAETLENPWALFLEDA